jgi:hypothetical protein
MDLNTDKKMASEVKGQLTFRIAAVLFFISTVFELLAVTSGVPLFGATRSGLAGIIYHLAYVVLYAGLGLGLWFAKPWGYALVFVGTAFYTLDKAQYIVYRKSILRELMRRLGGYREVLQMVDQQMILNALTVMAAVFAACWWGFAIYTYYRRDYFRDRK